MTETTSSPVRVEYWDIAQTAAFAGYSDHRWRKLVAKGLVPQPIRIGGKLLWRNTLMVEYMRSLEIEQGVIPPTAA